MGRVASLVLCASCFALFAACGGAADTQLLDDAGQPQNDATAVDTGGGDGGKPQNDATVEDVTVVDVVTKDVPVLPPDSQIHCGNTTCSAQTQICCGTVGTTTITYACVASTNDCAKDNQIAITCSSTDNCASQGSPGFMCCGLPNGPTNPNTQCNGFSTASTSQCQQSCDANNNEFEIGCSVQTQNCADTQLQCITSQCTLPGFTICR